MIEAQFTCELRDTIDLGRELARRQVGATYIGLYWREIQGDNTIVLYLRNDDNNDEWSEFIDPKMAWWAYTHAAIYAPEMFNERKVAL